MVVEPARRIDEYSVHTPGRRRLDGVERDRGGIAPLGRAHEGRAEVIGPYLQLLGGTRAKCVGGCEQTPPAFPLEGVLEVFGRRRLARGAGAENREDRRGACRTAEGGRKAERPARVDARRRSGGPPAPPGGGR